MVNPFIGQITIFAGNFAPRSFAFCDGQLISIAQNSALFSILGTTYGGDGRTTFGLPDLRGRAAVGPRRGPGLSTYQLGQKQGLETVTLNLLQLPSHSHQVDSSTIKASMSASKQDGGSFTPGPTDYPSASTSLGAPIYGGTQDTSINVAITGASSLMNTGNQQWHENRRPFLAINYIIAMYGTYPSRS